MNDIVLNIAAAKISNVSKNLLSHNPSYGEARHDDGIGFDSSETELTHSVGKSNSSYFTIYIYGSSCTSLFLVSFTFLFLIFLGICTILPCGGPHIENKSQDASKRVKINNFMNCNKQKL